ncbi:unnamed protein product [Phytophthora fragariaefolia]|uniref:Unnamed protein product n=1 Tax=Phytophthora fragariaefolia TaxID=1490495 RepID=A0A9W6XRA1_9STRA|nr:unnamed protein product [Phytophthora fragariaefolia]
MLARAVENGFPVDKLETLRTIVHAYDVWRFELCCDPAAKVPPLEVWLQEGARPAKCKPRKSPPHIRQLYREFNSRLVELGLVCESPNSQWASPVLPVKKSADLMDLRQTTDCRATLNSPDNQATTCLFTDASDPGYAVIITQVQDFDPATSITEQQHRLAHCTIGQKPRQRQTSTLGDEASELPLRDRTCPWPRERVDRYDFSMGRNHIPTVKRLKAFRAAPAVDHQPESALHPLDDEHFEWSTLDELREVQSKYSPPPDTSCNEDGLWVRDDRFWIPTEATKLLQRLCVVARCGTQGYRG